MAIGDHKALEGRIRHEMQRLRERIRCGDDAEILYWPVRGQLACAQRPLRDHPQFGGRRRLSMAARPFVVRWVGRVREAGVQSIICLLVPEQVALYDDLHLHSEGLLGYYGSQGFEVRHLPATDCQRPSAEQMQEALNAFNELPKPVLLHCSAAIDRTTPVAAYIVARRNHTPEYARAPHVVKGGQA